MNTIIEVYVMFEHWQAGMNNEWFDEDFFCFDAVGCAVVFEAWISRLRTVKNSVLSYENVEK